MPLTKSEVATLRGIERDAKKLAIRASRFASKTRTKLLKEMRRS